MSSADTITSNRAPGGNFSFDIAWLASKKPNLSIQRTAPSSPSLPTMSLDYFTNLRDAFKNHQALLPNVSNSISNAFWLKLLDHAAW